MKQENVTRQSLKIGDAVVVDASFTSVDDAQQICRECFGTIRALLDRDHAHRRLAGDGARVVIVVKQCKTTFYGSKNFIAIALTRRHNEASRFHVVC